jgi:predicted lipoprotein with Yx(FWY)xxD motif
MKSHHLKALLTALGATFSACLLAAPVVHSHDGVLVAANGMTLYIFDSDPRDQSRCKAWCQTARPPFVVAADANLPSEFGVIVRADGSRQISLQGKALYFYAFDQKPGDVNGDGAGGAWHAVRVPNGVDALMRTDTPVVSSASSTN